ncbi:hypothetical protein LVJ82_02225 [Vitreoscilla massiliensis]|uniref:Uncharacterized protein n=1 Tax=Vitreoscilla massiliensis TaxID=1689272 RepID=A0ABY4E221_9NEIS|nr:hypothetical protein [Vitreoscilla massiliensis]UOO89828.1 hypothetical protein LVJ82_02225 [Vitreoscilla massiliensis]
MKIYHYQLPLRQFLLLAVLICLSFSTVRLLAAYTPLHGVMAAVFSALLWAAIPAKYLNKIHISRFLLLDAVYVGVFISLDAFISGWGLSIAACILASVVYLASNRLLTGLGGRLGMQAFIACVILLGVHTCLQWQ